MDEYKYKFLCNRQRPDIPFHLAKEYDEAFGVLMECINENLDKNNPLYRLIKRKDVFATIELIELSIALKRMNEIDPGWVKHQLRLVAGNDVNNAHGAINEIMTLGSLCEGSVGVCTVKPSAAGTPGIDGYLTYNDGTEIGMSIKYYGESFHQKDFRDKCKKMCEEIEKTIYKSVFSIQLSVNFKKYPDSRAWEKVKKLLSVLLEDYKKIIIRMITMLLPTEPCTYTRSDGDIEIILSPLFEKKQYPGSPSYILNIWTTPHKNEFKSIIDKIQLAEDNLEKHFFMEDNKRCALFIHMPTTYPLNSLSDVILSHLQKNTNKIDYIILYTAIVAYDESNSKAVYHVSVIHSHKNDSKICFRFKKAYGRVAHEIPLPRFGGASFPEVKDKYFFQRGKINLLFEKPEDKKEWKGTLENIAPGIELIYHLKLDDGTLAIKRIDNLDDELLIS